MILHNEIICHEYLLSVRLFVIRMLFFTDQLEATILFVWNLILIELCFIVKRANQRERDAWARSSSLCICRMILSASKDSIWNYLLFVQACHGDRNGRRREHLIDGLQNFDTRGFLDCLLDHIRFLLGAQYHRTLVEHKVYVRRTGSPWKGVYDILTLLTFVCQRLAFVDFE